MNQKLHIAPEDAVKLWVQNVVVKYNFCPFAATEVKKGSIRYMSVESPAGDGARAGNEAEEHFEHVLFTVLHECQWLDQHPETETTLLVLPQGFEAFYDFLDLADLAESLLVEQGYEGIYQIATFHPDYQFEGCPHSDAANYTNRAPYPVLHLLRESALEQAIANYPNPESIPERNTEFARRKGAALFQDILTDILGRKAD